MGVADPSNVLDVQDVDDRDRLVVAGVEELDPNEEVDETPA